MPNLYDIAYALGVGLSAPIWLLRAKSRAKVFAAFRQRMGRDISTREDDRPAVMIHAVSLGEMNATRGLVNRLRELRPDLQIIISTTTKTGHARARELYGPSTPFPDVTVIHYPLDFSPAVRRVLDALRPSAVVLMELEVWPNFIRQCSRRSIPALVINGRMTQPSFRKYKLGGPVVRVMLSRLAAVCAQDETNASRFTALGVPKDRVSVTSTMKFDTATVGDRVTGDEELARTLGLRPRFLHPDHAEPIWVCGSTGPGEERLILDAYRLLLTGFPSLRLVIVPRHPERFDEVADLIRESGFSLIRRSETSAQHAPGANAVVLGDTMGELRKFYSLADVVFVGRTLVDLGPRQHGSDMIEPAALGKPVIVGPYTGNFSDVMAKLRDSMLQANLNLSNAVRKLLEEPGSAMAMGQRARELVQQHKGATERHVQTILSHLPAPQ